MSQHDYNLANAAGASFRADANAVLDAIASQNAGSTAPSVTFPNMRWFDTANSLLMERNNANTAWITIGAKDASGWRVYHNGTLMTTASLTWTAAQTFASQLLLTGMISPPQITADQNDYNPGGLAGATTLRLTSDATRKLTGLAGGVGGRILALINVGSNSIDLENEDTGSAAVNRFALSSVTASLAPGAGILLQYDGSSARWRPLISPDSGTAPDVDVQVFDTDGTWTKPAGFGENARLRIEIIGSGGGGGNRTDNGRGAGGAGGLAVTWDVLLSDADATEDVIVGAGGAGAPSGSSAAGQAGSATSMTFGDLTLSVPGGPGGDQTGSGNTANGGTLVTAALAPYTPFSPWAGTSGTTSTLNNVFQVDGVNLSGAPLKAGAGGGGGGAAGGGTSIGGNTSVSAGDGGAGNHNAGQPGGNGVAPGGGGGGSSNDGGGGNGAAGFVRVTVYEP